MVSPQKKAMPAVSTRVAATAARERREMVRSTYQTMIFYKKCQDVGGGEADRHKQADGKNGQQGESDVDQHVGDNDPHHLVLKVVSGQQPDKESCVKLLGRWC